ncbi:MAG: hypothetical protein ACKVOR_11760 [Flavobacteriales bacterium]
MKKIISNSLVLGVIAAATYICMCYVINHISLAERRAAVWMIPYLQRKGGQEQRMMYDYKKDTKYDAIVIGSSHAYRGYDPRVFEANGLSLFNAGSSSQHALASRILMNDFIKPAINTLVIIDIYDKVFEGEGMECNMKLIQNASDDPVARHLLSYQPDMRTFNAYITRQFSSDAANEVEAKGYITNGYCTKQDTLFTFPDSVAWDFVPNHQFLHALDGLMQDLERAGIKYILVSHPQPAIKWQSEYHSSFVKFLSPLISTHNARYVDLTFDKRFNQYTCFADQNHMNQAGVDLFNHLLIDSLRQLNYLNTP